MPILVERELTREFRQSPSSAEPSHERSNLQRATLHRDDDLLHEARQRAPLSSKTTTDPIPEPATRLVLSHSHEQSPARSDSAAFEIDPRKERETQLYREAERLARIHANQNFDSDPSRPPDNTRVEAELRRLAEKYSDVATTENRDRVQRELLARYQQSYESLHTQRFENELNWVQRRYYGTREWLGSAWRSLPSIKSLFHDAVDVARSAGKIAVATAEAVTELVAPVAERVVKKLTDPDTYLDLADSALALGKTVADGTRSLATSIGSGLYHSAVWLSKPENLASIRDGIIHGARSAYDFVTSKETWIAAGKALEQGGAWVLHAVEKTGDAAARFGSALLKVPSAASADFVRVLRGELSLGEMMRNLDRNIVDAGREAWAITKSAAHLTAKVARAGWGLVTSIAESTGITDILHGAYTAAVKLPATILNGALTTGGALMRDALLVARGELSADALKENLKRNIVHAATTTAHCVAESARLVVGGLKLVGEVTGITDAGLTLYYAARGEWGKAALHGAFALASWGSIAATIGTGGVAAGSIVAVCTGRMALKSAMAQVAKQALKSTTKEGFELLARNAAESAVERVAKKLSPKLIAQAGERAAREVVTSLDRSIARHGVGAASVQAAYEHAAEATAKATEKLMKRAKVSSVVEHEAGALLERCANASKRGIARDLRAVGVARREARDIARDIHGTLRRGRGLDEYRAVLEREMNDGIRGHLEREMKPHFTAHLDRRLHELEHKHSLVPAHTRALRESAERGFDDALERVVSRHVGRGIGRAFARLHESVRTRVGLSFEFTSAEGGIPEARFDIDVKRESYELRERKRVAIEEDTEDMLWKKKDDTPLPELDLTAHSRPHETRSEVPSGFILGRFVSEPMKQFHARAA